MKRFSSCLAPLRPCIIAVATAAILMHPQARAQSTYTWDTATGDGATITDGSGTWQVGVGNWNDAGTDVNWADGNKAVFGGGSSGTAGTVTLGGDISADTLTFNAANSGTYTINLSGFNLGVTSNTFGAITGVSGFGSVLITDSVGTGALSVPATNASINLTGNMTIDAKVTGTTRVFTAGAGNLTVTNPANDFTGEFGKQNGGILSFSSVADTGVASAAGAGSSISVGFNAQLQYTGGAASTNRELRLFGNNGTLNNNGTGALVLTGAVNNQMNNNQALTLGGTNTDANEVQGAIGNNGANVLNLSKSGAGTWVLSGANTYTGATTIGGSGVLEVNAADVAATSGALGNGGAISFAGGSLRFTAASAGSDYSARIVNSSSAISIDTNGQTVTFGTTLASTNSGGLTKSGAGILDIKMGTSYSGTTTIHGGTLRLTNVADLATVTTDTFLINNGSRLEIASSVGGANRTVLNNKTFTFDSNGGGTIEFVSGNHLFQGGAGGSNTHIFATTGGAKNTITSSAGGFMNMQGTGNIQFNVADGTDDVDLELSATFSNGLITKNGAGKLAITGSHSGNYAIAINQGALEVGGSARLNSGTFTAAITNDGVLQHSSSQTQTLSGDITGTGSVVKSSGAVLTLSGTNSYAGTTTVTGGTLLVNGDQSAATGNVTVDAGGTLGGSGTIGGASTITGIHSPGNSPGLQTFSTDLTYNAGASVIWELTGNTASLGDRGSLFDGIDVGGNLDFSGGTTVTLSFNSSGDVDWSNLLWSSDQSWLLYEVAGSISNLGNLSVFTDNWADAQGDLFNTVLAGAGGFSLSQVGSDVFLNYTAIPEPSRMVLLALGGMLALGRRRRSAK